LDRFGAGIAFEYLNSEESVKLVDCGIAFVVGETIKVIEPLSQEVVVSVIGKYYVEHTKLLLNHHYGYLASIIRNDKTNQAKGLIWQHLILSALINTEEDTVEKFFRRFTGDTQLKPWATFANFKVVSTGKIKLLEVKYNKNFKDEIEVLEAMINGEIDNFILEPSNLMRPDGIYLKRIHGGNNFFSIQVSCKILESKLSGKGKDEDRRSTDFTKLYQKIDDTGSAAPLLQARLYDMLKPYNHIGSLRIHCILPGITGENTSCSVSGNDLILYINKTNLEEFLGEELARSVLDLLEYQ